MRKLVQIRLVERKLLVQLTAHGAVKIHRKLTGAVTPGSLAKGDVASEMAAFWLCWGANATAAPIKANSVAVFVMLAVLVVVKHSSTSTKY